MEEEEEASGFGSPIDARRSPLRAGSGRGGGIKPKPAVDRIKTVDVPLGELVAPAIFGEECLVPYVYPAELGGGEGAGRHAFSVTAAAEGAVVLRLSPDDLTIMPHAVRLRA